MSSLILQTAVIDLYVWDNDPSEANVDWQVTEKKRLKIKF